VQPAAALANRVLEREAWARERLAAHAGQGFVLAVGPVATGFRIDSTGLIASAPLSGGGADLTLSVSPLSIPSLLSDPSRWDALVTANGAPALAATLRDLALTLPWFVEQAFAKALGPVIGQRVADAGRRLLAFPEYAVDRVSESVGSYARDEADLLARGDEARAFAQENAALAARVDALEPRLDALAARLTAAAAPAAGSNP
jgi:ubiquinone biosynthesis protein UbiJ